MKTKVVEGIRNHGYIAELTKVTKNGVVKEGIVIRKDENEQISPVIYFDDSIEDVEEQVCRMIRLYEEYKSPMINIEEAFSVDNLVENLRIGYQRTSDEEIVKRNTIFEGIEEYLYMNMNLNDPTNKATAKIRPMMLEKNGIEEEAAWRVAQINTMQHTKVSTMASKMAEMMDVSEDQIPYAPPLYVISNHDNFRGAANIMDEFAFKRIIEDFGTNKFFALPSSIHEWLIVADDGKSTLEEMTAMVTEVNDNEVAPEERLSYQAYKIIVDKEVKLG